VLPVRRNLTIAEAIEAARVSRATYYAWLKYGLGPRTIKIGRRFVSPEAFETWRRECERRTAENETTGPA